MPLLSIPCYLSNIELDYWSLLTTMLPEPFWNNSDYLGSLKDHPVVFRHVLKLGTKALALSEKFRYLPSFWDFSQNLTKYNLKNHHYLHQDSRFMQFCCIPYSRSKPFQGRLHFLLSSARTPANTWGSIIGWPTLTSPRIGGLYICCRYLEDILKIWHHKRWMKFTQKTELMFWYWTFWVYWYPFPSLSHAVPVWWFQGQKHSVCGQCQAWTDDIPSQLLCRWNYLKELERKRKWQ